MVVLLLLDKAVVELAVADTDTPVAVVVALVYNGGLNLVDNLGGMM